VPVSTTTRWKPTRLSRVLLERAGTVRLTTDLMRLTFEER
jgi:hypothetical protein